MATASMARRDLHQAQGVCLGFCESLPPQTVQAEDVIFLTTTETTGTTGGQREETMKLMSTADNRQ